MTEIITVGLDLAKNVFQVHGADGAGRAVLRKKFRRVQVLDFFSQLPSCVVAMEACGDAHLWGREIGKLRHDVRLIPPAYVKRQKNDMADVEAICEAAMRPTMRFVPVKSEETQGAAMAFRVRVADRCDQTFNFLLQRLGRVRGTRPHVHMQLAMTWHDLTRVAALEYADIDDGALVQLGQRFDLRHESGQLPHSRRTFEIIGSRMGGVALGLDIEGTDSAARGEVSRQGGTFADLGGAVYAAGMAPLAEGLF